MISIEVTLNADPTAISPVVEGIMEMARRLECAAGKEFEIETALREALANAIVHGWPRHALGRRVWEGSTERCVLDRRRRQGFRRCQLPGAGRPHESVLLRSEERRVGKE